MVMAILYFFVIHMQIAMLPCKQPSCCGGCIPSITSSVPQKPRHAATSAEQSDPHAVHDCISGGEGGVPAWNTPCVPPAARPSLRYCTAYLGQASVPASASTIVLATKKNERYV